MLSQVSVQLSLAFGVAIGGGIFEGVHLLHGGAPGLNDFHVAFWAMATVTLISALIFLRVPRSANMHSHRAESGAPAE